MNERFTNMTTILTVDFTQHRNCAMCSLDDGEKVTQKIIRANRVYDDPEIAELFLVVQSLQYALTKNTTQITLKCKFHRSRDLFTEKYAPVSPTESIVMSDFRNTITALRVKADLTNDRYILDWIKPQDLTERK